MKKYTLILLLMVFPVIRSFAQYSIANGNFENWTPATFEYPDNYPYNSNPNTFSKLQVFNCIKVADSYHGNYAVQLTTLTSGMSGYFINFPVADANTSTWHGGIPYTQKPTGIRGYYKSAIPAGDSANIIVSFSVSGNHIATYIQKLYGTHSNYIPFSFSFSPTLTVTPDSVIFGVLSSDAFNGISIAGSMIQMDSVSLTGVNSQPSLLNGDFEQWQSQIINQPDNWYGDIYGDNSLILERTNDNHGGNYAIKLTTHLATGGASPHASRASINSGYYDQSGNPMAGSPFTNQIDTLTFWYKYFPSGNDSAQVELNFVQNGSGFYDTTLTFGASSIYRYAEFPFETPNWQAPPDKVLVKFLSSLPQSSSISFVGSYLILDAVTFKSQPFTNILTTSLNKDISVFPNPAKNWIMIKIEDKINTDIILGIYNSTGQLIKSESLKENIQNIDISNLPNGVYMVDIKSKEWSGKQKLIIQR